MILFKSDVGSTFMGNIVVDNETKTIFVIFTHCQDPSASPQIWTNYIIASTDDGRSWSDLRNISDQTGARAYKGGPGLGVQKRSPPYVGRLIACGHSQPDSVDGVYCIHSDDHGVTWAVDRPVYGIPYNQTKIEKDFHPNEATLVELPTGDLMVNARNQHHYHCHCRITLISKDGGYTFPIPFITMNEDLPDEGCAAGLATLDNQTLLFTNPDSTSQRYSSLEFCPIPQCRGVTTLVK